MPYLRVIRNNRWDWGYTPDSPTADTLTSDALSDLGTTKSALSVWFVRPDESNLGALAAAITANREGVSNIDYVLVSDEDVVRLGISIAHTSGDLPCETVNKDYHHDLAQLTARRLADLAYVMQASGTRRLKERDVRRHLVGAIRDGLIDRDSLRFRAKDLLLIDALIAEE